MLTTIKGYYENGNITLKEEPPVQEKTEVMITFLTEEKNPNQPSNESPEVLKAKYQYPMILMSL